MALAWPCLAWPWHDPGMGGHGRVPPQFISPAPAIVGRSHLLQAAATRSDPFNHAVCVSSRLRGSTSYRTVAQAESELAIAHSAVPTSPLCTPCNGNISAESHTLQLKTTSLLLWLCSTRLSPLASAFSDFTRDTPHAGFPAAVAKVSADAGRSFTATTATGRSFTATRVERSNELASSTHALIACLFHLMRSCRQSL